MSRSKLTIGLLVVTAAILTADEGMWRLNQLPLDTIAKTYGLRLAPQDIERLQNAPVRLTSPGSGGTGTFASPNGLILTNHHVALDCIRTSTLAEQNKGNAENLIEKGFTAKSRSEELSCKRFRAQVERSSSDMTAELNAGVTPGMSIADIQRVRQQKRSDLERTCEKEKGANFACDVVDFNSGASSLLITYENFNDIRLVYAPEKQLGYFGGDEMNFRFPRYVADISILRAYVGTDGSHGDYEASHVPYQPTDYLRVSLDGVKDGDVTLVAGNPGNTNRYRISDSAVYNLSKGIPNQIQNAEAELGLLRKYAAMKGEYQVLLQERIFGLANSHKYLSDVLAALKTSDVVARLKQRETEFLAFLKTKPESLNEYRALFEEHHKVYATLVEANADLDAALDWVDKASVVGQAITLYQWSLERAKSSDREREPQFQERNWPDLRRALLDDEPTIPDLEMDLLATGFQKALALPADKQIPAVRSLVARAGSSDPHTLARATVQGSKLALAES